MSWKFSNKMALLHRQTFINLKLMLWITSSPLSTSSHHNFLWHCISAPWLECRSLTGPGNISLHTVCDVLNSTSLIVWVLPPATFLFFPNSIARLQNSTGDYPEERGHFCLMCNLQFPLESQVCAWQSSYTTVYFLFLPGGMSHTFRGTWTRWTSC